MTPMSHQYSRSRPLATSAAVVTLLAGVASACQSPDRVPPGEVRGPAASPPSSTVSPGTDTGSGSVRVVTVGDIACEPGVPTTPVQCQDLATADLATSLRPDAVVALGDLQYESGNLEDFSARWSRTWGRFDDIVLPVPGNHEYGTDAAAGYVSYFDTGPYYAHDLGAWRVYLLDSNFDRIDCEQEAAWLTDDLTAHPSTCTAIAMHHPRWSSSTVHGSQEQVDVLWKAAVDGGVDLSLAGHDHDYERFAPLDTDGGLTDTEPAASHFVVGTGGRSFYQVGNPETGSAFAAEDVFGVLELTLDSTSFGWRFVDIQGDVLDQGDRACT